MSALVGIEFKFPDLAEKLRKKLDKIDLFMAAVIQTNRAMLFDAEGNRNGHSRWAPLKFRSGMILSNRGNLRKSIGPNNATGRPGPGGFVRMTGGLVTVGTNVLGAKLMNNGGKIVAKNAKALRIPLPAGKSATDIAKQLRKGASKGKEYLQRIAEYREEMARVQNPARRAKMSEQLAKMEKNAERMKANDRFIFRKSVKVPARPFNTITRDDYREFSVALKNKIVEILNT